MLRKCGIILEISSLLHQIIKTEVTCKCVHYTILLLALILNLLVMSDLMELNHTNTEAYSMF